MSARRLQQPAPIKASGYRWAGTCIVTTLAVLPEVGNVNDETIAKPPRRVSSIRRAFQSVVATANLSRSASTRRGEERYKLLTNDSDDEEWWTQVALEPPVMTAREGAAGGLPDLPRFLNVQMIREDFEGSHIPAFFRPPSLVGRLKVGAVRAILDAYENGSLNEELIKTNFPHGDFQQQWFAYLRFRMETYEDRPVDSLETRLIDTYVTCLKDWCATVHDFCIAGMEKTIHDFRERVRGQKGERIPCFLKQGALRQKDVIDSLAKQAFKDNSTWHEEWRKYKKDQRLTHSIVPTNLLYGAPQCEVLLKKGPYFISWLLRTSTPKFFLEERRNIAEAIKRLGGPSYLINSLKVLFMHAEDVAQYKQWMPSQAADSTDQMESRATVTTVDVPKVEGYLEDPLRLLDLAKIAEDFDKRELPPFLQLGCGFEEIQAEAIVHTINLHFQSDLNYASALIEAKVSSEEFREHFFATLRRGMRKYSDIPMRLGNSTLCCFYQIDKAPGNLIHAYITGLQKWCANVHEALKCKAERAIEIIHNPHTKKSKRSKCILLVKAIEPNYTHILNGLMRHIDPKLLRDMPQPPECSPQIESNVARLQRSIFVFNWLIRNLSWDCFLFWRDDLARAVRELDRGLKGFSFLASVLESLAFTDREADEFKKYYGDSGSQPADWNFDLFEVW